MSDAILEDIASLRQAIAELSSGLSHVVAIAVGAKRFAQSGLAESVCRDGNMMAGHLGELLQELDRIESRTRSARR